MKNNRNSTRKSFLSFGVLSPQDTVAQQVTTVQPSLEKKVPQATFKTWRLRRYES